MRRMAYELHCWPGTQARGEFVRLALEAGGAPYIDVVRGPEEKQQGLPAMMRLLGDRRSPQPPFAPPILKDGDLVLAQTAVILHHLGPELKLVARSERSRLWTQQIQLTIADLVAEVQSTHHPITMAEPHEAQQPEALRRARWFCAERLPKYLNWFEAIIANNPAGSRHLVAGKLSYADLSLFQLIEGLRYAFPRATEGVLAKTPLVLQLHRRVASLPKVAAYLKSPRRLPFGEHGIFRHYPELDLA